MRFSWPGTISYNPSILNSFFKLCCHTNRKNASMYEA